MSLTHSKIPNSSFKTFHVFISSIKMRNLWCRFQNTSVETRRRLQRILSATWTATPKTACEHFASPRRCEIIRHRHAEQHLLFLLILGGVCVIFCVRVPQVVSEKAYESWSESRRSALAALDNREELVMDTAVQLETNLSLLGNIQQP